MEQKLTTFELINALLERHASTTCPTSVSCVDFGTPEERLKEAAEVFKAIRQIVSEEGDWNHSISELTAWVDEYEKEEKEFTKIIKAHEERLNSCVWCKDRAAGKEIQND